MTWGLNLGRERPDSSNCLPFTPVSSGEEVDHGSPGKAAKVKVHAAVKTAKRQVIASREQWAGIEYIMKPFPQFAQFYA